MSSTSKPNFVNYNINRKNPEWKVVEGHPDYSISDEGRIISRKRGNRRFLSSPGNPETGYCKVTLDGQSLYLHHLVAQHFLEERPSGDFVLSFKNSLKHDCRAANLRWLPRSVALSRRTTNILLCGQNCSHDFY
jgi:hypothetical protein